MTLKNTRLMLLVLVPFAFAGCVRVEMPEHLVSDTVGAGKDLVHAIATRNELRFSNTTVGELDAAVPLLKRACVDELVNRTRGQMQQPQLDFRVVDEQVGTKGSKTVVSCQIAVKS